MRNLLVSLVLFPLVSESSVFITKLNNLDETSEDLILLYNEYGSYSNGPAFLVIGPESSGGSKQPKDFVMDVVNATGGVAFAVEHRCYSDLDDDQRWINSDIQYCTSDQALTDFVKFIKLQSELLPAGTKWIAVGCSYPGRLAVKLRGLYPDVIHGAWASSALLVAKPLFSDFYPVVVNTINKTCGEGLARTANYLIDMSIQGVHSCIYNPVYRMLTANMIRASQYNYKIMDSDVTTLEEACFKVLDANQYCNVGVKPKHLINSTHYYVWKYQECHEFGYVQDFFDGCEDDYSIPWSMAELDARSKGENILMYKILTTSSRILLVYGTDDPWTKTSPHHNYTDIVRLDIPEGSHCSDWIAPADDAEVHKYREQISQVISSWL